MEIPEDEYLIREPQAEYKSEYRNGRVMAMAGATEAHNLITVNLTFQLVRQLKRRPCKVFAGDMRVKVARAHFYTYPDVSIVCGETRYDDKDKSALVNPRALIEVLSPSTEQYDRTEKFGYYKELEPLEEYVVVAQDRLLIERFTKVDAQWEAHAFSSADDIVMLDSVGCRLAMRDVYDRVKLGS